MAHKHARKASMVKRIQRLQEHQRKDDIAPLSIPGNQGADQLTWDFLTNIFTPAEGVRPQVSGAAVGPSGLAENAWYAFDTNFLYLRGALVINYTETGSPSTDHVISQSLAAEGTYQLGSFSVDLPTGAPVPPAVSTSGDNNWNGPVAVDAPVTQGSLAGVLIVSLPVGGMTLKVPADTTLDSIAHSGLVWLDPVALPWGNGAT